jgi:ketosteroid isomerase-like protein
MRTGIRGEARAASAYEHWVGSEGLSFRRRDDAEPSPRGETPLRCMRPKGDFDGTSRYRRGDQAIHDSFLERDAAKLVDLVADDCVMESAEPAPNGIRYEGYDACLCFWQELIADPEGSFEPEDVLVSGDRATIRWRYRFGEGEESSVRGVTLMHVRDGKIVEALGYVKAGLRSAPAS